MRLRDFFCAECSRDVEDVEVDALGVLEIVMACPRCGRETVHRASCNGGMGSRYRFADFPSDPEFYSGQVRTSLSATTADGSAVEYKDGGVIADKINNPDRRDDRRDRRLFAHKRKRGRGRLWFGA